MDNKSVPWLQRAIHPALPAITNEIALFAGIFLVAIFTRFYILETRVMSHDESLHTYFSWLLYRGQGYQHTPMMHGPYQFHIIALTYFLFGVSDFTARIPAVLFSLATVWMVWYWRRFLGNWGMIVAAVLMVVSPYMLYYGRYVRNESFVGFSGILLLYSMLRYLENGGRKYLYLVTAATVLHFTAKETAFIYTAQALLFLGLYFLVRVLRKPWEKYREYQLFVILLSLALVVASIGAGIALNNRHSETLTSLETAAPANPGDAPSLLEAESGSASPASILFGIAATLLVSALGTLIAGYGWATLREERSFGLLILLGTFVLPMLTPFPIKWLERSLNVIIPTDAASVTSLDQRSLLIIGAFVAGFLAISIMIGMLWNREWWKYGAMYWGVFTILYTTVFTNPAGFFTGIVGSLGYWLVQQGVERGSQPEYYYWLVQIPMYEFLPALGVIFAVWLGLQQRSSSGMVKAALLVPAFTFFPDISKFFWQVFSTFRKKDELQTPREDADTPVDETPAPEPTDADSNFINMYSLLLWWSVTSVVAFSVAGERMPWLTYHMAWPMILLTGWGIGQVIESVVNRVAEESPWHSALAMLVLTVFAVAVFNILRSAYGPTPPFQGTSLDQLQATSAFIFPLLTAIGTGVLLFVLMRNDLASLGTVALIILLLITVGSSIINGAQLLLAQSTAGADPNMINSYGLRFGAAFVGLLACVTGIIQLSRLPRKSPLVGFAVLTIFGLLAVQTARTSFRASYINYNDATEYLVYAHGAGGVKEVISQVAEISERTAGGLNAVIAYDASAPDTGVSWPMVWYLRDFTAQRSFDKPTRSLREAVAVIVDQKNFDKIDAALGDGFYRFDYIRMWWPNQDYFGLEQDRNRVLNAITNPDIRSGIFDIWLDRDYTRYAQATGNTSLTLTTWIPADQMRLYVRKDVASQIWNYGVGPSELPLASDPYEAGTLLLGAEQIFSADRYLPLGLSAPRGISYGVNDDLYVADSRNHRILHLASDGSVLHEWGNFGDVATGNAPIGTFNEPWGIAVGPDGSVYVTDTWNHRVQKFSRAGRAIKTWGQFGQPAPEFADSNYFLWGPRGIAVDSAGRVFVADTGNKRILIFDEDGNYLSEFGSGGFDPGQFDEPVGVAVGSDGVVYVTDTWNQRIQTFIPSEGSETDVFYFPLAQWDVNGWFGQSLDNKPFIAVRGDGHVFITDPEGYRVIEFTSAGGFVRTWGDFGTGPDGIGLASGIAVDPLGFVWVTDAVNNRILKYRLP